MVLAASSSLLLSAVQPAAAVEQSVRIRRVEQKDWPRVSVTVSTSSKQPVEAGQVTVQEDGIDRAITSVESLVETGGRVDVALVIDTSGSMQGKPIASAIAAATDFIRSVPEHIRVGVVTFSDEARVALRLTTDRTRALESVGALVASGETALHDALDKAARMFRSSAQRNIVLLSDGEDTASRTDFRTALAHVKDAAAAVFAVGLTSPDFDGATLKKVARLSGGNYSPAAAADLSQIYEDLASELSNQFVVTYRSATTSDDQVSLSITTPQGSHSVLFLPPPADPRVEGPPKRPEPADPLLRGTWGLVLVVGLFFGASFGLLTLTLGGMARRRRERDIARRISAPSGEIVDQGNNQHGLGALIPSAMAHAGQKVADAAGWTEKLDLRLEQAAARVKPGEFVAGSVAAAVVGLFLGALLFQNILFALLFAFAAGATPVALLSISVNRRKDKLQEQLPDILTVLASSLRAGHSFLQALDMVAKEVDEPAGEEFVRVVTEVRLGRPATDAMNAMAERIASEDLKWAVLAVNIQREVGGNLAELLDNVAATIRERETIRRQVKVLSAEGRLSIYILVGLPIGIAFYIGMVNPEYLGLLWTTRIGVVMSTLAVTLLVTGLMWMRKVVRIDV